MPDLPIPDVLALLDKVPDTLRVLMVVGLTLLLVILRFDAERFNAAEYDDIDRWGRKPSLLRRLAWYLLGLVLILLVLEVHPAPAVDLYLTLGERLGTVVLGLAYGSIGAAVAIGIALYRYRTIRFPPASLYPAKITNAVATAFIDEAVFRGIVFGFLISTSLDANLANILQAMLYALATRLGAPGRPWYMLVTVLVIGVAGGWLTGVTGGIGAAFLGHAITRIAIFLTTGHAGIPKARGTEDEEVERRRRTPEGWKVLGSREGDR
ncbi:MAG TPA: CPBP family intramembrane glutamic endopeptidase [Candidatus Limnocylindrales bacterium]|nr:CPBP family intramembrane glutamic endopeptidase [Candidatus Limnocylindrales bacterium]